MNTEIEIAGITVAATGAGAIRDSRAGWAPEGAGGGGTAFFDSLRSFFQETMVVSPGRSSTENLCRRPAGAEAMAVEVDGGSGGGGGAAEGAKEEDALAAVFSSSMEGSLYSRYCFFRALGAETSASNFY